MGYVRNALWHLIDELIQMSHISRAAEDYTALSVFRIVFIDFFLFAQGLSGFFVIAV
jgi:hypothetical protein